MAWCHHCGGKLPQDSGFCPSCGTEVPTADADNGPGSTSREVRKRAALCHLSAFAGAIFPFLLGNILGPLVVWLLYRRDSAYIDLHGRQAINFQISLTLYLIISLALIFVMVGLFLLPLVLLSGLVLVIRGALRANEGTVYRYPFAIPFLTETPFAVRVRTALPSLAGSTGRNRVFSVLILPMAIVAGVLTRAVSPFMRRDSRNLIILILSLGVAGLMSIPSGRNPVSVIALIALTFLLLRFATGPLSSFIARRGMSIRWKFEIAIIILAIMFLSVGLISFGSMEFMHRSLHDIQDLGATRPSAVLNAVSELEDTNHGLLFTLVPFLGAVGVLLSTTIGAALASSIIGPVQRMDAAMRRISAEDFSQPAEVENEDELGELADRINETAQNLAIRRDARDHELRIARITQQALLPRAVPTPDGWEIQTYYRPAREVGGDFYDFLDLADGRIGIVIGDVSDKGVPAALVMATTRSILRATAAGETSPGQVLEKVNDLLLVDIPPNMFVTCLYAILDPSTGQLLFANAGHDLPYWRHDKGLSELRATGMPLGLMHGMRYEEKEMTMSAGDSILLHSDGIAEAHSPDREMFGFPRLKRLTMDHPGGAGIIDSLLAELAAFTGDGWEQEDDVTLVSLQRAPVSGFEAAESTESDASKRTVAEFELSSKPGNERQAVAELSEAITELGLRGRQLERLKTAVAEATMNAMEHGNGYRPDLPVSVKLVASSRALSVYITDHGGDQPIPEPEAPDVEAKLDGLQAARGWGLFLIKNLVDELHVTSDQTHHTIELIVNLEEEGRDDDPSS